MESAAEGLLATLQRRVRGVAFATAAADAFVACALASTCVLVVARLSGLDLRPAPAWLGLCALPLGWGAFRSIGSAPARATAAAWLDRRMRLGGLLMTSAELPAEAWRETLARHLAGADPSLPRLDTRSLLRRVLPALVALAIVLLLEPPAPAPLANNPLLAHALEELRDKVERAATEGALAPDERGDLEQRLDKLEQAKAAGEAIEWADVDTLTQRVERALERRQQQLQRGVTGLDRAAAEGRSREDRDAASAELAKALRMAREAGLLGELPKQLREKLEQGLGAEPKAGEPAATPEQLQALAKELREHLEQKLKALEKLGVKLPPPGDPAAMLAEGEGELLAEALECLGAGSRPCSGGVLGAGPGEGEGAQRDGAGRGGITRGGGSATLELSQNTDLATKGLEAQRLPQGKVPPKTWSGTLLREAPEVDPVRSDGAGGQGQAGTGAVSWRRRLSPEHREAVKRYFGGG